MVTANTAVGPAWFTGRVAKGDVIVIDGATGTGLQARGVPMIQKGWSVMAQLEHPEILRSLHEDYIRAGASVIVTNTFAAGRHMLEPSGLGSRVGEAHSRAVEIAISARDAIGEPVVIAGSVSTYMADHHDPFWLGRLETTYREQVELLAGSGVDVIALEMMDKTELARPAVEVALESGLPVWLGLSARRSGDRLLTTYHDEDLDFAETARSLIDESLGALFAMHTPCSEISQVLDVIDRYWNGATGVYPEAGYYEEPYWHFVDSVSPEELVGFAVEWVGDGALMLGGCCGFDVEHIAALTEARPELVASGPDARTSRRTGLETRECRDGTGAG